jgi:hypothetical protein
MTKRVKQRFEERTTSEEYLHKSAWCVVGRQIEYAEAKRSGALYDDLVAMMFTFLCFEGFLNFVGDKIAPDLWNDEKKRFKGDGIYGKLEVICERCGLAKPDKGRPPYLTLSALKILRDAMAHPKIHKNDDRVTPFAEGKIFPEKYLTKLVSHEKALRARDDVKWIACEIHKAARAKFPDADLGTNALEGIVGRATT